MKNEEFKIAPSGIAGRGWLFLTVLFLCGQGFDLVQVIEENHLILVGGGEELGLVEAFALEHGRDADIALGGILEIILFTLRSYHQNGGFAAVKRFFKQFQFIIIPDLHLYHSFAISLHEKEVVLPLSYNIIPQ